MSDVFELTADPLPSRASGSVPRSSVIAGQQINRDARIAKVVEVVRLASQNRYAPLTSAELTRWLYRTQPTTDQKLTVRRGLSDAAKAGYVEHVPNGERPCAVAGTRAVTWRLRSR